MHQHASQLKVHHQLLQQHASVTRASHCFSHLLQGLLAALLSLLSLHGSSSEQLACAALELLALASKVPKAAAKLAGQPQLLPAVTASLAAYEGSSAVCTAALRCLRRLAKQSGSRAVLLECGAVPLLLSSARRMAVLPGQRQQVKVRMLSLGTGCVLLLTLMTQDMGSVSLTLQGTACLQAAVGGAGITAHSHTRLDSPGCVTAACVSCCVAAVWGSLPACAAPSRAVLAAAEPQRPTPQLGISNEQRCQQAAAALSRAAGSVCS
jgi:hypothetical protein